jgi:disulfide bond formation protein DsbB
MSEYGNHWAPCRFCWFQRIFMYSSAVVLIMAAIRRDRGVKWYAVPLASIGILLSGYHILLEHRVVEESVACSSTTSCANPYYVSFGKLGFDNNGVFRWSGLPITLAVMAFCGFAAILALLLLPEHLDLDTPVELTERVDSNGEPAAS